MEQLNNWEEWEELMKTEPSARACAMGVSTEVMNGLARLREMDPFARYSDSDIGNAQLFAAFYQHRLLWMTERKSWFAYENGIWTQDAGGLKAMTLCKTLVKLLALLVAEVPEPMQQPAQKRVSRLGRRMARDTILRDAQDLMCQSLSAFDSDPWLLNCQNGTLDLRTGELLAHDPAHLLTSMANVKYDPLAVCPRWETFIDEIMSRPGEQQTAMDPDETREKAIYLQKLMGYALTGDTRYECMYMFYGPSTRNGKGTLVETIVRMLGSYARTARPETLAAGTNQSGSAPNEDLARLRGARFVSMSEPDFSQRLNVALIKRITGNDTLTARFLHANSFEFRPQFKIFLSTNHMLAVTDPTLFTSGRISVIPFERHFAPEKQDLGLKAAFSRPEALSAVLNWCLQGLRRMQHEGLQMPSCLRAALQEYEHDVDIIAQFMDDCLTPCPGAKTKTTALYARYQQWAQQNGYPAENIRWFKKMIAGKGRVARSRVGKNGNIHWTLLDWKLI